MKKYDAIIILGGGRFNDGSLTPLSMQRLDKGCKLYNRGFSNKVIVLGGVFSTYSPKSIKFKITGADIRCKYLIVHKINSKNIIKIPEGRDTIEEAFVSRKVAKNLELKKLLITTSDKHLKRALFIFRRIYGKKFIIDGKSVSCGDLLNKKEENEYLETVKEFFKTLPDNIPDPANFDDWYKDNKSLYDQYRKIHLRYLQNGKETNQAYMGVKN